MEDQRQIVIIGGVAAGPKAAARARRLMPGAEITVVEQGELISYGSCGLPLYLGGMADMHGLTSTAAGIVRDVDYFDRIKDVRVLTKTRAVQINRPEKTVTVCDLAKNLEKKIPYDFLVLATGAEPVFPSVPGKDLDGVTTLHHPGDAQAVRAALKDGAKKIVVIGGGLIGLETAAALMNGRREVVLVEREEQLLPGVLDPEFAQLVSDQMEDNGIEVRTGESLLHLEGDENHRVKKVITSASEIDADLVIMACGVRPNVKLAKDCGLMIGPSGAISVNEFLQTSDPNIYAGGDCAENKHLVTGKPVFIPLASTANKHGRVIGSNLAGMPEKFAGVLGTMAMQVFDYNVGRTGLTESQARKQGYPVVTAVVSGHDTAHYYPEHGRGTVKLVAHRETGKLLGAQAAGEGEFIKRIDVFAAAIQLGADLDQVNNLDLGYAPPFATPIDLCLHAVNTVKNKKQGLIEGVNPWEMKRLLESEKQFVILDVRNSNETKLRPFSDPRLVHIPLSELRFRIDELPLNKQIITFCPLGVRAYEAACILKGKGFADVAFSEGGIAALPAAVQG